MLIIFFDEIGASIYKQQYTHIYFNERLYDLCVGLPYEFVSNEGDMNYRLKAMYNKNNLVPHNTMLYDPVFQGQIDYIYRTEKFVHMYQ